MRATRLWHCLALAASLAFTSSSAAQDVPAPAPKMAALPSEFAGFSTHDVLTRVFTGYDRSSGRVKTMLNESGKPALVRIIEAKPWQGDHLVVLIELGADDHQITDGLCGNCNAYALLAVLKKVDGGLALVARQQPPAQSSVADGPADDGPISYSGHSSLSLDLAPYKLNAQETLVGVRTGIQWIPARTYAESLALYRVAGTRLVPVFDETVVDREYPESNRRNRPVVKTVLSLSTVPSTQTFYDLRITRTTVRCIDGNDDWDCNASNEAVRRVSGATEVWRFDGTSYTRNGR